MLRWSCSALLLLVLPLSGCYSLAQLRVTQVIHSPEEVVTVGVWLMGRACPMGGGDAPVAEAVTAVVFYPMDVLISTIFAIRAPFDPRLDITWGPVGAVAGIALPWITLMPHLYPPPCMLWPTPEVHLSSADFQQLVHRIGEGDGVAAYHQLLGEEQWACRGEVVMSVVLVAEGDEQERR